MTEPTPPLLQFDGLMKWYGASRALAETTAQIQPGAIGLLGPNGAGKSTLIKILLGLVSPSSGHAAVLGLDIRSQGLEIRRSVGYMPEDDTIFPRLTGVESVRFAAELSGYQPIVALQRAHEILDYVGFGEERYREVGGYSLGMRQKTRLAMALVHSPRLVFLDEPTSGLDPRNRERMLELIRDLWTKKGIWVVVSTHILADVEQSCDAVMILRRGELVTYDRISTLSKGEPGWLHVEFVGPPAAFREALTSHGIEVFDGETPSTLRLRLADAPPAPASTPGPAPADESAAAPAQEEPLIPPSIFQAAAASDVRLVHVQPSRSRLEDIFLSAVAEAGDAEAAEVRAETGRRLASAPFS